MRDLQTQINKTLVAMYYVCAAAAAAAAAVLFLLLNHKASMHIVSKSH